MVVDNYFNHTAATYRGLHGQLCSLYPKFGGNSGWYPEYEQLEKTSYLSLPDILHDNGYRTVFLDAHLKDKAYVDDMVHLLGFRTVLTARGLSIDYLHGAAPGQGDALSDTQLFKSLVGLLKREETNVGKQPFMIGLYNYGTHSWVNPTDSEKKYGDAWNPVLNAIHNLDNGFGLFWSYFRQSPYADNTIIIFTADHCHYPTKAFVATVDDPGFQRIFVDRIPLIIHDARRKLPARFDARNRPSLDLAPSLLHYLGIANRPNPFLGRSLFDRDNDLLPWGVAAIDTDIYLMDGRKIYSRTNSREHGEDLRLLEKFISVTRTLEVNNKIWPPGEQAAQD
jgi:phosphoglycerol transferase MdoB-like AlkP superfamily enzyme